MGITDGPKGSPKEIDKIDQELFDGIGNGITDAQKVECIKIMFTKIESTIDGMSKKFSQDVSGIKGFNQVGDSAKKIEEYFKDKIIDNDEVGNLSTLLRNLERGFKALNNSFGPRDPEAEIRLQPLLKQIESHGIKLENSCGPLAIGCLLEQLGKSVDIKSILEFTKTGLFTSPWDLKKAIEKTAGSCNELNDFKNYDDYYSKLEKNSVILIDSGLFNSHYVTITSKNQDSITTNDGLTISKKDLVKLSDHTIMGRRIWKV